MNIEEKRACVKCRKPKLLSAFETRMRDGRAIYTRNTCRKCMNDIYDRGYKDKHREAYNAYQKKVQAKTAKELGDTYIIGLLKKAGFTESEITVRVIRLKRANVKLKRRNKK